MMNMGKKQTDHKPEGRSKPGPKEERLVIEGDPESALHKFLQTDKKRKRNRRKDD